MGEHIREPHSTPGRATDRRSYVALSDFWRIRAARPWRIIQRVMNKRLPGRPSHDTGARDAILAAATAAFSSRGFEGATIRQVAASAGVDPALVLHYFRSKRDLYIESVELPFEPADAIRRVFANGAPGAGHGLVALLLEAWDPANKRPVMLSLLRSAVSDEFSAALLRERLTREILVPIISHLGSDRPDWRASLAACHLSGLGLARYIVGIEPLASAPDLEVVAAIGPIIQHYLTGDLALPELNGGNP